MNIFLVVAAVVLCLAAFAMMFVILQVFQHPDDKDAAYFPKAVVMFGLWLAVISVLFLPFDVANSRGAGGGLRLDIFWQIVYITLAIMVSVVIPYAFFFYENDEDPEADSEDVCEKQWCVAIKYTLGFFVVFVIILVIMYTQLNTAQLPVRRMIQTSAVRYGLSGDPSSNFSVAVGDMNPANVFNVRATMLQINEYWRYLGVKTSTGGLNPVGDYRRGCSILCVSENFVWELGVTFPIYVMAMVSFIGWFFFSLFVGVGFFALPLDLINEYRTKPLPISKKDYYTKKVELGNRATALIKAGETIMDEGMNKERAKSSKNKKTDRKTRNLFHQHVYQLQKELDILTISYKLKGGNILWYYFKLGAGCCSIVISISWVLHIILFVLPSRPIDPFLNTFFVKLEEGTPGFPLFGAVAFGIFALYLLLCCLKGAFRMGMRVPFLFTFYPMEVSNTYMNAFLVNTWIFLVCSVPTVQFSVQAFPIYARFTAVDLLFGTQVQYLKFFNYFWRFDVFIWILIIMSFLSAIYLTMNPIDQSAIVDEKIAVMDAKKFGQDD